MNSRQLRILHFLTDGVLVAVAWLSAYGTRAALTGVLSHRINPVGSYLGALPLIVIPWLVACWFFRVYQSGRHRTTVQAVQAALRSTLAGLLVVSTVSFFFKELDLGRSVVLITAVYVLVLQGISRAAFDRVENRLRQAGAHDINVLLVGAGESGIRLTQKLQDRDDVRYQIVGFLDDAPDLAAGRRVAGYPVLGTLDRLREVVKSEHVEEVIIAIPSLDPTRLLSLVIEGEDLGVTYSLVTDVFHVLTADGPSDTVGRLPLVQLARRRMPVTYEVVKRIVDLIGASIGLLLTAALWPWWALRIKLDSPGPILFKQSRVGQHGKVFTLYKFRTMRSETESDAVAPSSASDSRVTRYGRWLRKTSIDELPNLINVLRGEMSIVGPRPEMPFIVDTYAPWQTRRLVVKPGVTGLWQILGRKDLPMHDNLQYDFYYIHNRSLLLDISIMWRTVAAVLQRKGAF